VASLGRYAEPARVDYFGLDAETQAGDALRTAADSVHCPFCGSRLRFDRTFYSHLGHYRCPEGDYSRPPPGIAVSEIAGDEGGGSTFTISTPRGQHRAEMRSHGLHNIYNATAALTIADAVGMPTASTLQSLKQARPAFGRSEEILWDGRRLHLVLVKNPAGFTQVLNNVLRSKSGVSVLLAINDSEADGRDVSWLWDVPVECLTGRGHRIVVTGGRADDLALRLRYAEVKSTVITGTTEALAEVYRLTEPGAGAYLLASYTAMLAIRRQLGQIVTITPVGRPLR
jgi:UDP-N-acetylmuramyl tripeptide synthase